MRLGGNLLYGNIPPEIGFVSTLEALSLDRCFLSGVLPSDIGKLTALTELNIGTNAPLTGPLPTELGLLTQLQILDVSTNQFTGAIPTELGNIETLVEVRLGANSLTGAVPDEVCTVAMDPMYALDILVVDCQGDTPSVTCEVPTCCSGCSEAP